MHHCKNNLGWQEIKVVTHHRLCTASISNLECRTQSAPRSHVSRGRDILCPSASYASSVCGAPRFLCTPGSQVIILMRRLVTGGIFNIVNLSSGQRHYDVSSRSKKGGAAERLFAHHWLSFPLQPAFKQASCCQRRAMYIVNTKHFKRIHKRPGMSAQHVCHSDSRTVSSLVHSFFLFPSHSFQVVISQRDKACKGPRL